MRRRLLWQIVGIGGLGCSGCLTLGCLFGGGIFIFQFAFDLTCGWAIYCYRTLPQIRPSGAEILVGIVGVSALATGSHFFLRWLYEQIQNDESDEIRLARTWPVRWTVALFSLLALMFVAGFSAVGIEKHVSWIAKSDTQLLDRDFPTKQDYLQRLTLAMISYERVNSALHREAITDVDGRPLLSWRVAILPFISEEKLYKQFRLNEPWDSPHNIRLLSKMPWEYESFSSKNERRPYCTNYRVFSGEGTIFENRAKQWFETSSLEDREKTILFVEAMEAVPWTKPDELTYDDRAPLPLLGNPAQKFFLAGMVDSRIFEIDRNTDERDIRAWIKRDGEKKPIPGY